MIIRSCSENMSMLGNTDLVYHLLSSLGEVVVSKNGSSWRDLKEGGASTSTRRREPWRGDLVFQLKNTILGQ